MRRLITAVSLTAVALTVPLAGLQLKTPAEWKWRTDSPATVTDTSDKLAPDQWYFVGMPPGWHVTTSPGVLLYHPAHQGRGNFSLQSEIFLFPGDGQEEYGVFLGGQGLEPAAASPSYTAFVARRDGRAAILRRSGSTTTALVDWKENDAVAAQSGTDAMKNALKVDVGATEIVFSANTKEIARVPRAGVPTDGALGFRVGKAVNLHIATLDVTYRLAPVREGPPR